MYCSNTVSGARRRSGVPSNAIGENVDERAVSSLSSLPRSFLLTVARARPRAGRGVESRRADTFFRVSHLAARVHDYDAPVPCKIPLSRERERELRGLGHAVGSRDPPSFSPARIVRGGGRARARAPLREITAGTPLIPGRRRRRRETALTPLSSSSSSFI